MKITVEHDSGEKEIYQNITDAYLCVRQLKPLQGKKNGDLAMMPDTRSFSWGGNVREMVKEIRQSLVELEDWLREKRGASR